MSHGSRRRPRYYRSSNSPSRSPDSKNVVETEKLFVGMENAPDAFGLRERLLGEAGSNFEYIRTKTGAMVSLHGGKGSIEALHILLHHLKPEFLSSAKSLAKSLIRTVQEDLDKFISLSCPTSNIPSLLTLPIDTSLPPPLPALIPISANTPSIPQMPPSTNIPLITQMPPSTNIPLIPQMPPPTNISSIPQIPPFIPNIPPPLINDILSPLPLQFPSTFLPESTRNMPPMDAQHFWHLREALLAQSLNPFQMQLGLQGMIPVANENQFGQTLNVPLPPVNNDPGSGPLQPDGNVPNNVQQLLEAHSNMRAARALLQETIQQSAVLANSVNFSMALDSTVSLAQNAPGVPFQVEGNMLWNHLGAPQQNPPFFKQMPETGVHSSSQTVTAPDFSIPPPRLLPPPTQLPGNPSNPGSTEPISLDDPPPSLRNKRNAKRTSRWDQSEESDNTNSDPQIKLNRSGEKFPADAQTSRSFGLDEAIAAYMKTEEMKEKSAELNQDFSTASEKKQPKLDTSRDRESLMLQLNYLKEMKLEQFRRHQLKDKSMMLDKTYYRATKGYQK